MWMNSALYVYLNNLIAPLLIVENVIQLIVECIFAKHAKLAKKPQLKQKQRKNIKKKTLILYINIKSICLLTQENFFMWQSKNVTKVIGVLCECTMVYVHISVKQQSKLNRKKYVQMNKWIYWNIYTNYK